ncbi:hypothetical protein AB1Y20_014241 [Prymnesium parvum]|uniref:Ribosome assembly factor mrt4 n=1 Tax=Prymnesium parvum TaxID=97485 RepID=A0AB34IH36_PRYPA|mmetsp:Transcript_25920/g.59253  ORF Transcript_25920/g.59253 Transcript_25920/m.59253 type:complete len:220 (+) Transcript_25920:44-703(+)
MPKSKRDKKVTLSKTQKKGRARKESIVDEVRHCVDTFQALYVFTSDNMRNAALKTVRQKLRESRIFFGRTKLLAAALGKTPSDEYRDGISEAAKLLRGHEAGMLFTNDSHDKIVQTFESSQTEEFARAGTAATDTVVLEEGPLDGFPHNMEPYLRKLGLPTKLNNGVVHLLTSHTVCREGDELDGDQAKLLQLLGIKMSVFKLSLRCRWSDGDLQMLEM